MKNSRRYWLVALVALVALLVVGVVSKRANFFGGNNDIVQSSLDEKAYRYVELDNGLRAILVSDSKATLSAVSLNVNIGNSADPREWQGLAHFLEHMLFLGTEKYPEAGEYMQFLSRHGGTNNAYTSYENTNYFFSIPNASFVEALDRFAWFFIAPTFDETYVNKERENVNSEYQLRKQNDARRLAEASKAWLNPEHPAASFSVGSNETLRDRASGTVRDQLIAFYDKYYSANLMTLAMVSNMSLDAQEELLREKFTDVENHHASKPSFDIPYRLDQTPKILFSVPDKQIRSVTFAFDVPSTRKEYQSKPFSYISNLMGDEGKGSLFALLKEKGWVESLSAGRGFLGDDIRDEFHVSIGLTEQGVSHIKEIGDFLFAYIDLVKQQGIEKWRFGEQSKLAKIGFEFAEAPAHSSSLASSLAARLNHYETEDVLTGPYLRRVFDSRRLRQLMTYLTPDNVNIQLVAPGLATNAVTPFYDTQYRIENIDENWLSDWRSVQSTQQLTLPPANPFIAEELTVGDGRADTITAPALIETDDAVRLWHRRDVEFKAPRADFYVNVLSPIANDSARHRVLTRLMVSLLNVQLNDAVYPAYLAGLSYSLYSHGRGVTLTANGFEEKQSVLLDTVLQALAKPDFDPVQFEIIKQALARDWQNRGKDNPANQIVRGISQLILGPFWTEQEKLDALSSISLDDVRQHYQDFFKQVAVQALSYGSVDADRAKAQTKAVVEALDNMGSQFIDSVPKSTIRVLDSGNSYAYDIGTVHDDSALGVYYQALDDEFSDRARVVLLNHLMRSRFFYHLRTVNKVGYLADSVNLTVDKHPGLILLVQSPVFSPQELLQLYNAFIATFLDELQTMSQDEFLAAKQGLLESLQERDKQLSQRSGRYWQEIQQENYDFNSLETMIDIIKEISKDNIIKYYKEVIVNNKSILYAQSVGGLASSEKQNTAAIRHEALSPIQSIQAFRRLFGG